MIHQSIAPCIWLYSQHFNHITNMKRQIVLVLAICGINIGMKAQHSALETLIIGTYTPKEALQSTDTPSAYVVTFNAENGNLTLIDSIHTGINASFIAADTKRKQFYAVNELAGAIPQGKIRAFSYSIPWNRAVASSICSTQGNDPCHVSIDTKNNMVTAANYSSGNIISIKTNTLGKLNCDQKINNQHKSGNKSEASTPPHAHQTTKAPFGNYLYACDLGANAIFVYKIKNHPLAVEPLHTIEAEPGAGPRHMLFHPNQKFAYVVNELNGTVECFSTNKKNGNLSRIQTVATTPDSLRTKAGSADIHITSDGKYLYTSNRGVFNEIICFEVNTKTGMLRIIGHYPSGGTGPRNFMISNNNRFMLVANQRSNKVVVFAIDPQNGALTPTDNSLEIHAPVCITEL